ncbi:unnamed protein product [marine sediment metagenome]|uniref:Uncharacterized protein n=1 Tax=marine sediment metagenome TaxID=412755 RepID=X1L9T6_9ZZZZ
MAKKNSKILNIVAWITGVVVSLVVGFGMINGTLGLPTWLGGGTVIGDFIVLAVGWIVVVTTLVSAILAILNQ